MKTFLFIAIISIIITVAPIAIFVICHIEETITIKAWRKTLKRGDSVMVDDGTNIFKGMVTGIGSGYVRIISNSGQLGAYGTGCIYPLNYVIEDEEDYNFQNKGSFEKQ